MQNNSSFIHYLTGDNVRYQSSDGSNLCQNEGEEQSWPELVDMPAYVCNSASLPNKHIFFLFIPKWTPMGETHLEWNVVALLVA